MKLPNTFAVTGIMALLLNALSIGESQSADYEWSGPSGTWTRAQASYRIERYNGADPGVNGPTQSDNLTLINAANLQLQNSGATLAGGSNREINNLSSSIAGGNISAGTDQTGGFPSITVFGDLNLQASGASLTFWNQSATPITGAGMTASVLGNITIAQDTALYLGVIRDTGTPTSVGNYLNGFSANSQDPGKGQIQVDGVLMLNRSTNSVALGDVTIGSAGVVTLTGAGVGDTFDGFFNKTVQVRSLQGSGILQNSIVTTAGGTTSSTATLQLNTLASTDVAFGGVLRNGSGTNALLNVELNGSGRQVLAGANTYTGTTVINSGTLVVGVNGSGSLGNTAVTVNNGGTLAGSGAIAGTVTVAAGGTLSPGNSPGTQEMGGLTLQGGGNYNWQIHDALGNAGATDGWDLINVDGALDLTNLTSSARFQINLWSLASVAPDVNGDALNFSASSSYQWVIITADTITYNNTFEFGDLFQVNASTINGTAGFSNANNGAWFVSLSGDNQSVLLNYQAIPEPSAGMLMLTGFGLCLIRRYFRKS